MPLIKLFGVLIRTLSKPISAYVKNHLQDSPAFGRIMTTVGRKYQRLTNLMSGHKTIKELDQNVAITLGSEIVVEGLFFGIAGGLILYDHRASKEKSRQLEERLEKIENKCFSKKELEIMRKTKQEQEKNENKIEKIENADKLLDAIENHFECFYES